jgi:hypothetical protein
MGRQYLEPIAHVGVEDVVGRLGAVQGQNDFGAQLSINTRRVSSDPDDLRAAIADGRLVKSFAFRGAIHLMTPETAGFYLALRASSKMWELPSWRSYYGLEPSDWPAFRQAVSDALMRGPLTRTEIGAAIMRHKRFSHLGFAFAGDNWTLLKPLAWQGVMSMGWGTGRATFQRLDANPRWKGLPELDGAGTAAIAHYLSAYGPATASHLGYWLGSGLGAARRRLTGWLRQLGDRVAEIDVDGEPALVLGEHLDELSKARLEPIVRLLPGIDQWVMGPGTADPRVTPPAHRALVTRGANMVVVSGVVAGTWTLKRDLLAIDWFAPRQPVPEGALTDEIGRLASILGREIYFHD